MSEKQKLSITIETAQGSRSHELRLSEQSCWGNLLGRFALPGTGAIDELDAFFKGQCPDRSNRIILRGCPSACLLVMMWVRSIWFADGGVELVIVWDGVDDPATQMGRQAAGKLGCILADKVECDDPEGAWKLWGIDVQGEIGMPEEAFDLLSTIVDLWDTDLHQSKLGVDWNDSVGHALGLCSARGHKRVGIYGAGTHTRAVGDALLEPGVEIVCVIDDDARRHGDRMWGYEIVSCERAIELELDAVVISANSIEDRLWDNCEVFRKRGIDTLRLYGTSDRKAMAAN